MIDIATDQLEPRDAYRLLISVVVPRPIGWVSTIGDAGDINLAPFSFFNAIGGNPPTVMFSVARREGQLKDTLRNVQETGEFVLNVVDESLAQAMNQTSGEWDYRINEFDMAHLATANSVDVRPPRVALAPVAMEAKVTQIIPMGETAYTLVLGRVVRFHIRDGLLRPNGAVDPNLLRPIARLSGDEYATIGQVFEMARPKV